MSGPEPGPERPAPRVRLRGSDPAEPPPDDVLGSEPPRTPWRPWQRRLAAGAAGAAVVTLLVVRADTPAPPPEPAAPGPTAATDPAQLYVSACDADTVYRVRPDGVLVRLQGTPAGGSDVSGGGSVAAGRSDCPDGLAFDAAGLLHVVGPAAARVRVVGEGGGVAALDGTPDGRRAVGLRALLVSPDAVGRGRDGTLYVGSPAGTRVRRLSPAGALVPLTSGARPPAIVDDSARPAQIAVDDALSAYFADSNSNRVFKVDARGRVTTVAGTGAVGDAGDGGPAVQAQLNDPRAVAIDRQGRLYVSEGDGRRVRRIDPDGSIRTVAGTGRPGPSGDRGPALAAGFAYPGDVGVDAVGDVYVVDLRAGAVRRVDPHGVIDTLGT